MYLNEEFFSKLRWFKGHDEKLIELAKFANYISEEGRMLLKLEEHLLEYIGEQYSFEAEDLYISTRWLNALIERGHLYKEDGEYHRCLYEVHCIFPDGDTDIFNDIKSTSFVTYNGFTFVCLPISKEWALVTKKVRQQGVKIFS